MKLQIPSFKWLVAAALVLLGLEARGAGNIITATVTVTNAAGTTNGQTITINGTARTWTNSVAIPASQILTNGTAALAFTNLFNQLADYPASGVSLAALGPTNLSLTAPPGVILTVSLSAGWGTVSYATSVLTAAIVVRVPTTVESGAQQTNVNSALVAAIRDGSVTNAIYESSPVAANMMGLTNAQTVSGAKSLTNAAGRWSGTVSNSPAISGNIAGGASGISNGVYWAGALVNPSLTNGQNFGDPFSSPAAGFFGAEQFGSGAAASAIGALAVGRLSAASGQASVSLGTGSSSLGTSSEAVGNNAYAENLNDSAFGNSASASGTNSTALGTAATVARTHINSTAIGFQAATTTSNQVMIGAPGISAVVQNSLAVGTNLTVGGSAINITHGGTNSFPAGSDITFGRYALSSLATGNNAGVVVGTNVFVEVSGPGAAFTVNGIAGGRDGKFLILVNQTTFNMTIAHDSGVDPTAGNRIYSMTGADRTTTGNGAAILIYSGAASRWILVGFEQ